MGFQLSNNQLPIKYLHTEIIEYGISGAGRWKNWEGGGAVVIGGQIAFIWFQIEVFEFKVKKRAIPCNTHDNVPKYRSSLGCNIFTVFTQWFKIPDLVH